MSIQNPITIASPIIFDLQEIGFNNLDGSFVKLSFDQKEFGNILYANGQSIEMDDFARSIHQNGKAELTEKVEAELLQLLPQFYKHRGVQAIKDYIERLKNQGNVSSKVVGEQA